MIYLVCVITYVMMGILVARLGRNNMLNKAYQKNLKKHEDAIERQRKYYASSAHLKALEEDKHKKALEDAWDDIDLDVIPVIIFGFFFWPALLIIFGIKSIVTLIGSFNVLPKSKAEKEVESILTERVTQTRAIEELKEQQKALLKLATEAGLDTKGLELIEHINRTKIENKKIKK